jgi:chemotaxis protein MotB
MAGTPPIIIKKKSGHGGHHGGAWKVAYADFVTAMMALFIVLWLMNSSKQIQEAVGGYFKDPTGTAKQVGSDMVGAGENFVINKDNMEQLKEQLQRAIKEVPNFDKMKNHIDMTVTNEGLRIELTESEKGTFFDSGSQKISGDGQELLKTLAEELGKLPNTLAMEGHTDSKPYAQGSNYGNWELSADRANAARRLMQSDGIRPDQVTQVRGFADQRLRKKDDPLDAANRRISLIVQYLNKPDSPRGTESKAEEKVGENSGVKTAEMDPARSVEKKNDAATVEEKTAPPDGKKVALVNANPAVPAETKPH